VSNDIISDETLQEVLADNETTLDHLIALYRDLRATDRANGVTTSEPALGGISLAAQYLGPERLLILLPLAIRRLADSGPATGRSTVDAAAADEVIR
jgi:hypothetical protein